MKQRTTQLLCSVGRGLRHAALGVLLGVGTTTAAQAQISQEPLFLGGGNVPGNLFLVPSVEWPTIVSVANLGAFDPARRYVGYFDANKCYDYHFSETESERHFFPVATPTSPNCAGSLWSGNYLNWAATQTIDPFRSALTGGYRVVDTPTETWLQKARHTGQGGTGIYPNRRLPNSGNNATLVAGHTPGDWNFFSTRIQGLGHRMRFTRSGSLNDTPIAFDPALPSLDPEAVYEVSIRVKVCDPTAGLEPNCRNYGSNWKPEGLLQQYADEIRFSVFGYLNDSSVTRDGAALRARQKFIGPSQLDPALGIIPNPNREWDPSTGVLVDNPDPEDVISTNTEFTLSIANSGVINYINRFGEMTNTQHKSIDPVSELYYAGLRYLRNIGPVAAYTDMGGANAATRARYADGFPVITDWDDPVQYVCQRNVFLGIGDIYTHRDKNLPGNTAFRSDEPAIPPEVAEDFADNGLNVIEWTNRVGQLEGLGNIGNTNSWTGRNNSAYLAGLAYFANTEDMRPDLPGRQSASTFWVDVLEAQSLEGMARNQFALATKYGGFRVPRNFDPATHSDPLPLEWWHTNGITLTPFGSRGSGQAAFPKPDNFFLAGDAQAMVESLAEAFAAIAAQLRGTASSVAANSTRVDADTAIYQALFDSSDWSGDLLAFSISTTGAVAATPTWSAGQRLDALNTIQIDSRRIFTVTPPAPVTGDAERSNTGVNFTWANLAASQQDALRQLPGGGTAPADVGQARLNYLRGVRDQERSTTNPAAPFRERGSRLGDIVNSDPQFIHRQDFGYAVLASQAAFSTTSAGNDYITFRQSTAYQARPPIVVVGANDGMLHGFDARLDTNGGRELFAFVPAGVMENLYQLTLPEYTHRYFVDGTPRIADAWLGSSMGWRTIVAGTTGAGGRSVFALDITNPENMTPADVLWEFTHPDMGYTIGQPAIVALPNGEFGVVVTSGYDSASGGGSIWFLSAADGELIHRIDIPDGGDLGAPLIVDLNRDRVADRLYVADTLGQLWRFDLPGDNISQWQAPNNLRSGTSPIPLFQATDAVGNSQPITAPLASAFNQNGEHMVFFGTGSFIRVDDNFVEPNPIDRPIQSFYAVVDRGVPLTDRSTLQEQRIITEQLVSGNRVRGVSDNQISLGQNGWYLDLLWDTPEGGPGARGERVVSRALIRGDRVIFSTLIPSDDPCDFGGDSYIMELNTFSGSRLDYPVFDIDGDGLVNENDFIEVIIEGETVRIPVSGIAPNVGIIRTPAVITGFDGGTTERKCVAGSSGELICITEAAAFGPGRQSWQQLR